MDTAAIQAIWDAQPYQRLPTPLGVFGKLPLEVRSQIYREFFLRLLVFLKQQDNNEHSQIDQLFASLMRSSRALRIEVTLSFNLHLLQFGLMTQRLLISWNRTDIASYPDGANLLPVLPILFLYPFGSGRNH